MASLYTPDMRSRPFTPAIGELDETGSIKSLHLKRPASAMINFQQMQSVMVDVHGIHEPGKKSERTSGFAVISFLPWNYWDTILFYLMAQWMGIPLWKKICSHSWLMAGTTFDLPN